MLKLLKYISFNSDQHSNQGTLWIPNINQLHVSSKVQTDSRPTQPPNSTRNIELFPGVKPKKCERDHVPREKREVLSPLLGLRRHDRISLDTKQFKLDTNMRTYGRAFCHSTHHTQFGRVRTCHWVCWQVSGSIIWVVRSFGLCSAIRQWVYLAVGSFYDTSYICCNSSAPDLCFLHSSVLFL